MHHFPENWPALAEGHELPLFSVLFHLLFLHLQLVETRNCAHSSHCVIVSCVSCHGMELGVHTVLQLTA